MTSTSATKKEVVDFLWDWAESSGEWAKLLVSKIVQSENNLNETEREEVFNYFLQSLGLNEGLAPVSLVKPPYTPSNKKIKLCTLSNIKGVNKLAKDQLVNFSNNITVIYGENGTGKTSYGRILKSLGFSYDTNNTIHHDIYGTAEPKSAEIKFTVNEEEKTFSWTDTHKDIELQNISVFNNNCVQISLSDRQLIVSPMGFHLFNLITAELNELSKLLTQEIAKYPTILTWEETLNSGTPQQAFISGLSPKSKEEKLTEVSNFTETHKMELEEKQKELSNLNKSLLQTEIQNLTASVLELDTLKTQIEAAEKNLTNVNWQALIDLNKQILDLETKTKIGIKDIAEANGIAFYASPEFQKFIAAAESYIKIIDKPQYPVESDTCVYCLQPLEPPAKDLLENYRKLLNDKTQENLTALKRTKNELITLISSVVINVNCHQGTFGIDNENKPIQPAELIEYAKDLSQYKASFISDKVATDSVFNFDYPKYKKFLSDKRETISNALTSKHELLNNLAPKEKELQIKIAELKDRIVLNSKLADIKIVISNLKTVSTLQGKATSFSTAAISRKTSEARQQLVEQNFNNTFQNELKHLRKSDLPIEISFGTDRGKSKISHRLSSSYMLADILSEGEQKAISLAEFLTELQLDNIQAPVIFDDPVNSLDHHIIDEVGKRLIELSKSRQVIIFTHSILLLNSMIQQSELDTNKKAGVEFQFHRVKSNFGVTGVIDEVEEINSYNYYTKKLNLVLETKASAEIDEGKLAAQGYGHLRSAIEVAVENDLLKSTIKRYRKGVAFPALLRIDGGKLDAHKGKLNDIYEKCCVSIDGHSSPTEIHSTPTISGLKLDWEDFKKIKSNFN